MGKRERHRQSEIAAAVVTVLLGWLLLLPLQSPNPLVRWSYDLLQLVLPAHRQPPGPVIIYMDEQAMQDYGQKPGEPWPRSVHARLLERLTRDEPRVVVFDVAMTQAGGPAGDDALGRAIHRNGRVILAGDRVPVPGLRGGTIVPPLEQFETNAAAWGIAKVVLDADGVARRYYAGDDQEPGLAWAAAAVADAPVTRHPQRRLAEERWLNYYGSARPFAATSMTYTNAETSEPGFFRGRAVFIGGQPQTLMRGEITDVFGSPFTKWNRGFVPGVEVTAIAYANLMHGEWLRRPGLAAELALLLVTGAIAGFGGRRIRGWTAVGLLAGLVALTAGMAIWLAVANHVWVAWAIVPLGQVPCALLCRLFTRPATARTPAPDTGTRKMTTSIGVTTKVIRPGLLEIPDHTLIRCIGEGAYGQVWIARNAIGLYHAVKVVYRNRFPTTEPYERALRGIQNFMPVSRSHEGFVHILHVGRNDAAGFYFYIMEAGDDQQSGQKFDPATYAPRTLAGDLQQRGSIPPRECLAVMLAVTEAVDRLHRHQLIHRDIKPSNIIFAHGRPKLADIDLVTGLSADGEVSRIGTEGYMAPEGPGTAAADVFSLGRVLYVALTGKSPAQSPELPTRIADHPDCGLLLELNRIVCRACEHDRERRYASAAALHADLGEVFKRLGQ